MNPTAATAAAAPAAGPVTVPPRIELGKQSAAVYRAMRSFAASVSDLGLEPSLEELVKIRASQINGCAYCIDMHTIDAEAMGETPQRIYALSAWRETPFFTARERAALAFTEAGTLIAEDGIPDDVYGEAAEHFDQTELAALIWLVAVINSWNRAMIAARATPGNHRPKPRR